MASVQFGSVNYVPVNAGRRIVTRQDVNYFNNVALPAAQKLDKKMQAATGEDRNVNLYGVPASYMGFEFNTKTDKESFEKLLTSKAVGAEPDKSNRFADYFKFEKAFIKVQTADEKADERQYNKYWPLSAIKARLDKALNN